MATVWASAVDDFDNDGFPEIYVTGVKRNTLYTTTAMLHSLMSLSAQGGVAGHSAPWQKTLGSVSAAWIE